MKKAQVTMFIIMAILFLTIAVTIFLMTNNQNKSQTIGVEQVKSFVEGCIEGIGTDAVFFVGRNGGYYSIPQPSVKNRISYWYQDKKIFVPTRREIESEVSYYVKNLLVFCTDDFRKFPEFNISDDEIIVQTKIEENGILFEVYYPIGIVKGEDSLIIENFRANIPIRFKTIYEFGENIARNTFKRKEICLSCISKTAAEKGLKVDIITFGNSTIYKIKDNEIKTRGRTFELVFATR